MVSSAAQSGTRLQRKGRGRKCTCSIEGRRVTLFPIKKRVDKPSPNDYHIVKATMKNVVEGISFEEISRTTNE